jgi:DNA polymerase I
MIVTQDNLGEVVNDIKNSSPLAVDTETTGLRETDRPFACIIATKDNSYYFDRRTFCSEVWTVVKDLLNGKPLVFQNAKFDMAMLSKVGITSFTTAYDTEVCTRLLANNRFGGGYSLKDQAKAEGLPPKIDVMSYIKENKLLKPDKSPDFYSVPVEIMAEYAVHDARLTYDLWSIYQGRLDEEDRKMLELETRVTRACYRMERNGICLDIDYTRQALTHAQAMVEQGKRAFLAETGKPYVNSAQSLCPIFEAAGETIHQTDSGRPSLTEEILSTYTSTIAQRVKQIRHYEKRASTYYQNYLELEFRGRVHPNMKQAGTRTGRFSYSDPNLQNIPKDESHDEPYHVRRCFRPTPGNILVSIDYSQQEYRMMLAYANEKKLIAEVMAGKDVHQATADLLGIERKLAKRLNFSTLYGAGSQTIGETIGIPTREADLLRTRYFLALPRVEQFIRQVKDKAKGRGYVKTWAGRKLRFGYIRTKDGPYHDAYTAPNHLIQGGAADVVKTAMARIFEESPLGEHMVLQVHDQLVFDMREDQLGELPKVKQIMREAFPEMNGMRLDVDVTFSRVSLAEADMEKLDGP